MTHYIGMKDLMIMKFAAEEDCPEEVAAAAFEGDLEALSDLLNTHYPDYLASLLERGGLDTQREYFPLFGNRISAFTGQQWEGTYWVGNLRSDLGFTTEHQVYKDMATEQRYDGAFDELNQQHLNSVTATGEMGEGV